MSGSHFGDFASLSYEVCTSEAKEGCRGGPVRFYCVPTGGAGPGACRAGCSFGMYGAKRRECGRSVRGKRAVEFVRRGGIVYPVDRIGVLLRRTCVRSAGCRKIVFSPETSSAAATSCRPAEGERRALGRYFVRTGDERPGTGTDAGLHAPKSAALRYGLHRTVRRKSEQQFAPLHLGDHPVDLLPDCFGECRARHFDHLAGRDGAYRAALFHR